MTAPKLFDAKALLDGVESNDPTVQNLLKAAIKSLGWDQWGPETEASYLGDLKGTLQRIAGKTGGSLQADGVTLVPNQSGNDFVNPHHFMFFGASIDKAPAALLVGYVTGEKDHETIYLTYPALINTPHAGTVFHDLVDKFRQRYPNAHVALDLDATHFTPEPGALTHRLPTATLETILDKEGFQIIKGHKGLYHHAYEDTPEARLAVLPAKGRSFTLADATQLEHAYYGMVKERALTPEEHSAIRDRNTATMLENTPLATEALGNASQAKADLSRLHDAADHLITDTASKVKGAVQNLLNR